MSDMTTVEGNSASTRFALETSASPEYVAIARLFVAALVRHFGATDERVEDARLAVSEACAEVIRTTGGAAVNLRVDVDHRTRVLHVRVSCSGSQARAGAGTDDRAALDAIPGLGLDVLRSLFDDATLTPDGNDGPAVTFSVPIDTD